jgi:hypothetical protein
MILSSKPGKAPLVLGDQHRDRSGRGGPGNVQHHPLAAGIHGLGARAVAVVAGRLLRLIAEMNVQLGVQHALGQRLLQLAGQALEIQRRRAPRSLINWSRTSRLIPSLYFLRAMISNLMPWASGSSVDQLIVLV